MGRQRLQRWPNAPKDGACGGPGAALYDGARWRWWRWTRKRTGAGCRFLFPRSCGVLTSEKTWGTQGSPVLACQSPRIRIRPCAMTEAALAAVLRIVIWQPIDKPSSEYLPGDSAPEHGHQTGQSPSKHVENQVPSLSWQSCRTYLCWERFFASIFQRSLGMQDEGPISFNGELLVALEFSNTNFLPYPRRPNSNSYRARLRPWMD